MRFGLAILPERPWSEAERQWRTAEELGFDHAWTYDHLVWAGLPDSPWFGTTPTLTAAALVTSGIGLGTFVSSPNFRHPAVFWRDVQSLDDLSGGRFLLGVGNGADLDAGILGGPRAHPARAGGPVPGVHPAAAADARGRPRDQPGPMVLGQRHAHAPAGSPRAVAPGRERPAVRAVRGAARRRLDDDRAARSGERGRLVRRGRRLGHHAGRGADLGRAATLVRTPATSTSTPRPPTRCPTRRPSGPTSAGRPSWGSPTSSATGPGRRPPTPAGSRPWKPLPPS